ncbi:MAG: EcsC family protein [Bacteroidota bacterium]
MTIYDNAIRDELKEWKREMQRKPSFTNRLAKKLQMRINRAIPEKVHEAITTAIKQMTRVVCFGAEFTAPTPMRDGTLEEREHKVNERIKFYAKTAAAEGAITGAGGILLGLADFPLWLTLKMKMLFEIAALYGFDVSHYKERIYLLYIFEITFSSQVHRNKIFAIVDNWDDYQAQMPDDINQFDWRSFQQEYRDYIDIAKLLQLVPGIGAAVGALVNHTLTNKLGKAAMNAYRLRHFKLPSHLPSSR